MCADPTPGAPLELSPGTTVPERLESVFPGGIRERKKAGQFRESSLTSGEATREALGLHHLGRGPFGTISPDAREKTERTPKYGIRFSLQTAMGVGGCACVRERAPLWRYACGWGRLYLCLVRALMNVCTCVCVQILRVSMPATEGTSLSPNGSGSGKGIRSGRFCGPRL